MAAVVNPYERVDYLQLWIPDTVYSHKAMYQYIKCTLSAKYFSIKLETIIYKLVLNWKDLILKTQI